MNRGVGDGQGGGKEMNRGVGGGQGGGKAMNQKHQGGGQGGGSKARSIRAAARVAAIREEA